MKFLDIYSQDKPILNKIYKDVKKVIRKSDFILGQETKAFEQKFAKYCNSKFAIGLYLDGALSKLAITAHS